MIKIRPRLRALLIATSLALPASALTAVPAFATTTTVATWSDISTAFSGVLPGQSLTIQLTADITAGSGQYLTVNNNSGAGGASITLDLNGHALNIPSAAAAAIGVSKGASLTINDSSNGAGHLTATVDTTLATTNPPSGSAAIGGSNGANSAAGTIVINGGVISATGVRGAGIGGGTGSSGVSGYAANGGNITINGGTVTATSTFSGGAGIGGGGYASKTGTVLITGGTVTATGNGGAGIGNGVAAGQSGPYGSITITGGDVQASSGGFSGSAGIGGGSDQQGDGIPNISISGGTVHATGTVLSAGIGAGGTGYARGGAITLSGGDITAIGAQGGAGIGDAATSDPANANPDHVPVSFTGCISHLIATGGTNTFRGGGAGLGGATSFSPQNQFPSVSVLGTMVSGSSTSGGNGAVGSSPVVSGGTLTPGMGASLVFDGNPAYQVTTSSTVGTSPGGGGSFTMSCVQVPIPGLTLTPGFVVGSPAANAPLMLSGSNLKPNSAWNATIRSTPVVFASGITDGSGSFSQPANLPASIAPGQHVITLYGITPSGAQWTRVLYITVGSTGLVSYISAVAPQPASSLAATGFNAALGVSVVVVLLAAGGAFLLLGRRRNRAG